jgi:hypothetical protein
MTKESKSNDEYEFKRSKILFWYAFLRISPSYRYAAAVKHLKIQTKRIEAFYPDFDNVLLTHDKFDNVWQENPLDAFYENPYIFEGITNELMGVKVLSSISSKNIGQIEATTQKVATYLNSEWRMKGAEPQYIIAIPKGAKKNSIQGLIQKAIEDFEDEPVNETTGDEEALPVSAPLKLMKTKVRLDVLARCYELVLLQVWNPGITKLELARALGLSRKSVEVIDRGTELLKKTDRTEMEQYQIDDMPAHKQIINTVIWRYTRHAYLLAENAARGKFPCLDEIKTVDGKRSIPRFKTRYIEKQSRYLKRKLTEAGLTNSFSREFLDEAAQLNRDAPIKLTPKELLEERLKWEEWDKLAETPSQIEHELEDDVPINFKWPSI